MDNDNLKIERNDELPSEEELKDPIFALRYLANSPNIVKEYYRNEADKRKGMTATIKPECKPVYRKISNLLTSVGFENKSSIEETDEDLWLRFTAETPVTFNRDAIKKLLDCLFAKDVGIDLLPSNEGGFMLSGKYADAVERKKK